MKTKMVVKTIRKMLLSPQQTQQRKSLMLELKSDVRNDKEDPRYPNQFYVCGYPQQLITDYNSFAKFDCQ